MPQLSNKMNAVCTVTASKFLKNIEFIMHCFAKTSRLALSRVTACESSSEKFTKIHVPASVVASVTPQNPGEVPPTHPRPRPRAEQVARPPAAAGRLCGHGFRVLLWAPWGSVLGPERCLSGLWRPEQWWGPPLLPWCQDVKSSKGETNYVFPRNQDFKGPDSQLSK